MQTPQDEADLHLNIPSNQQVPLGCPVAPISASASELLQLAQPTLALVTTSSGDFCGRAFDNRSMQRPTGVDVRDVNTAVNELIKRSDVPDPSKNPFGYLWMINCIVYSVVAALFVQKGWKKQVGKRDKVGRPEFSAKAKELFEDQACKIRVNQSKAKAEIERIKSNRKITRKGKRTELRSRKSVKLSQWPVWLPIWRRRSRS